MAKTNEKASKKVKKLPQRMLTHKEAQIQRRQIKVAMLWLWGCKETEISKVVKVTRRTIARDLVVIRTWPQVREVTYDNFRTLMQEKINDISKEMRLETLKVKGAKERIRYLRLLLDPMIEIWKKLMPTEIHLETAAGDHPALSEQQYKAVEKEMIASAAAAEAAASSKTDDNLGPET